MKKYNSIICLILGIITSYSLLFEITSKGLKFGRSNTMMLTYLILAIFLFVFYNKYFNKFKGKMTYRVISLIFSLLMVFGYSYDVAGNSSLVFGSVSIIIFSILKMIGYFVLFNTAIHLLNDIVVKKKIKDEKLPKILSLFDKHPFLFSFIVIVICYLPYIIAYYPVIINYDAANQIKEVMGIHTRYMDSVVLLNPNVYITNFNPIIHTLLIGGLFKVGYLIGNVNFGMFLYSIVQLIIVISVFAYSIYYLNKIKVNKKLILIILGIYALVPLFPFYAMTAVKDVIFSSLILLYCIKLYDIMKYKQTTKQYILFSLLVLLIILFRNNGIYTIVLSLPFAMILKKEIRKPILIIFIFNIAIYIGYNKVLLPSLEIANTSIREMLSVPFQQTARYAKYYGDEISDEDKKIIDKVLGYDDLGERYEPDLSDKVKNKYNKYTTDEELKEYFQVWFKYLLKRPGVYIDATINNVYGYFYPNTSAWYIYTDLNHKLPEAGFDYHFNGLNGLRSILSAYGEAFPYIPILGTIANIGMVVWIHILLLGMLIVNKMKKYIVLLLPAFSLILVCIVGPANTYFRYILPCVFALPSLILILYNELKTRKEL
ncbi:uncharacterized protein BN778_00680 [Mycoplasma sp. CAG:776]|nr:uncharacterized protein BN778_00680 [Mycoplasma sp. CAG:776]